MSRDNDFDEFDQIDNAVIARERANKRRLERETERVKKEAQQEIAELLKLDEKGRRKLMEECNQAIEGRDNNEARRRNRMVREDGSRAGFDPSITGYEEKLWDR